jgi:purine nucleosidase
MAVTDDIAPIRNAGGANATMLADFLEGYITIGTSRGRPGMAIYDPCAAVAFVSPDLVTFSTARIDVELQGSLTRGRTVVETRAARATPNAHYATDIDTDAARALILGALMQEARR